MKVIWGSNWDSLLAQDASGKLLQLMEETVDGDYQTFKSKDGAYVREHFFGKYPETAALVATWTDEEIFALKRGGHDSSKLMRHLKMLRIRKENQRLFLAKTVKGYGMGAAAEGKNIAHGVKKMNESHILSLRDPFRPAGSVK